MDILDCFTLVDKYEVVFTDLLEEGLSIYGRWVTEEEKQQLITDSIITTNKKFSIEMHDLLEDYPEATNSKMIDDVFGLLANRMVRKSFEILNIEYK